MVFFLVVFPFLFGTLDMLGVPRMAWYLMDATWLGLALYMIRFSHLLNLKSVRNITGWCLLFLMYTALVYIAQYQSPMYYLWGLRNNFRFYVAFLAFIFFMDGEVLEKSIRWLDKLFWLNVLISMIQYLFLGVQGDQLGGVFGTGTGANSYTNIFFSITIAKSLLMYMEGDEGTLTCMFKCGSSLLIAALAELKFFFLEFVLIIVLASLFTKFSWRKLLIIFGGAIGITICAEILMNLFPMYQGWFTLDRILKTAIRPEGYTQTGDLSRLGAIGQINNMWLTRLPEQLFGLGLGNCDTANFDIVNTPFYESYGAYHYTWISYAFMYLECGWVGLILYFGFFVLVYLGARRAERRCTGEAKTYCRLGKIMAICCALISIYNSSLRTEAGYMAYFVLAIPFINQRKEKKDAARNEVVQ